MKLHLDNNFRVPVDLVDERVIDALVRHKEIEGSHTTQHILFLHYLLLWFWDFTIKNPQDFIKIYRALIKDIFLDTTDTTEQRSIRLLPSYCQTTINICHQTQTQEVPFV